MSESLRIIFAGTPEFSVPPLKALLDSSHEVVAVFTQPDRPAGRGRKLAASPVKQVAEEAGVAVFQPLTLRDAAVQANIRQLDADLMVVVAYGLLLPPEVLAIPRLGCINIHASLLPRWRGAAPIQRAILAGDRQTGVTIMQMDKGLDTGPVWQEANIDISPDETAATLHDRLSSLGAEALMAALPDIQSQNRQPEAQSEEGVVYADKLSKDEGHIQWNQPAGKICRQVRAFNPWPVAYCRLGQDQMRIWEASTMTGSQQSGTPGTVLFTDKRGIGVQCGEDILVIERLQMPGKRAMTAAEFLNARQLAGARLE